MKKEQVQIKLLLVILISTVILTGCWAKETTNPQLSSVVSSKQEQSQKIVPESKNQTLLPIELKVHSETFRDDKDGTVLLNLKITYPYLKNPGNSSGIAKINEYYGIQFDDFISSVLAEGLETARTDKKAAQSGGYEFRPHVYERSAEISYNGNNLLSVLNLQYENTGGAHPNSFWLSETFDVRTGKKLALPDILGGSKEEALAKVYQTVLDKIKATEGTKDFVYQEGYQEYVSKNYAEDDFVLTGNSLMFYYQPYAIAAYAAGIPSFELAYNQLKMPALKISELPKNQLESDLYDQVGKLIDRNKEAYFEIFGLSMLKMQIPANRTEDKVLFPVTDERFVSFADLEQFVRGTYVQRAADALLGNGKYRDVNGKLYGDMSKATGMGYYVNWNDYSFNLEDITEKSAKLLIFTTDDSAVGQRDHTITVGVYKENDAWLLEKMVY